MLAVMCHAQTQATVHVDLSKNEGNFTPIYSWFGYDESNYTTTPNGRALLGELHDLSPVPVYVRAHFLLATDIGGDKAELKWSSSNVYTEDANGKPVYNWTILDQIFDAYAAAHVRPMVELGFMPKALSSHPDPYHIPWPTKPNETEGWGYPPKDYAKWGELAHQLAQHMADRYGKDVVSTWYWEVWNEPDIFYWRGTPAEYNKLYDFAVAGVRKAIPDAKVGGPASTGPGQVDGRADKFLKGFLDHCANDKSAATGESIPLDFISFHVKGQPNVVGNHVQMGLNHEMADAANGFAIIQRSQKFHALPIILSEADPEGCAACSSRNYPQNAYRNGPLYASYTAAAMKGLFQLADRYHVNLISMLTWAFEFEKQPYFDGLRTLATNGVDKPVLNLFRMTGLMNGNRVQVESNGGVPLDSILKDGVRQHADIDALATVATREAAVLLWNYQDDDVPGKAADIDLSVQGIPATAQRVKLEQYCIDSEHSNAYSVWQAMGSPQQPTDSQYARLKAAGSLELCGSPQWMDTQDGSVSKKVHLQNKAVALVRLAW
jgi:xylan 1,4-beta-xylosidase